MGQIIELSLIQLFKTEQILAESVCLFVCLSTNTAMHWVDWKSCISTAAAAARAQLGLVSAAAAAVWRREITASHGMLSLCVTSTSVS